MAREILRDVTPELREELMRTYRVRAYHPGCGGEFVPLAIPRAIR